MQLRLTIKFFNDWETLVGVRENNISKHSIQSYGFFFFDTVFVGEVWANQRTSLKDID